MALRGRPAWNCSGDSGTDTGQDGWWWLPACPSPPCLPTSLLCNPLLLKSRAAARLQSCTGAGARPRWASSSQSPGSACRVGRGLRGDRLLGQLAQGQKRPRLWAREEVWGKKSSQLPGVLGFDLGSQRAGFLPKDDLDVVCASVGSRLGKAAFLHEALLPVCCWLGWEFGTSPTREFLFCTQSWLNTRWHCQVCLGTGGSEQQGHRPGPGGINGGAPPSAPRFLTGSPVPAGTQTDRGE